MQSNTCPDCGNEMKNLGSHWSQSSCKYPEPNEKEVEIITGLLMGDGWMDYREEYNGSSLRVQMVKEEYLEYIDDKFGILTTGVNYLEERDIYCLNTRFLPSLNEFTEWYSTGEKVFPQIELSPITLKTWYVCDGSMESRCRSSIYCSNEIDRVDNILNMINDAGIPDPYVYTSERGDCQLRWGVSETEELVEYMGSPPPGFEYKWPEGHR